MQPKVLEHVGFLNVFLTDPEIIVELVDDEDHDLGMFGCCCCSEKELMEFVLFRAAIQCGCGRFDSQLEQVTAVVRGLGQEWILNYKHEKLKYEIERHV
jgi:hypothetical protein